jgi:glycosyltransferase involved in cell wall biosynthesis
MKDVTVVVPNKNGEFPLLTIRTLYDQSYKEFDILIINDFDGNANKARNRGLEMVKTEFVLFSDNDIQWKPKALQTMRNLLLQEPLVSYAYGAYEMNNRLHCNEPFSPVELSKKNFISTMSLVRTADHPGFDEKIRRLQDWDVWLTMLNQGLVGKWTGEIIFSTPVRNGITTGSISWNEAVGAIRKKHGL